MVLFRIARKNVLKNWRHSLAAMLSIAASFVAMGLLEGYTVSIQSAYADGYRSRAMLGDVVIEKKNARLLFRRDPWSSLLDPAQQAVVDKFLDSEGPRVLARSRYLRVFGVATNGRASGIFIGSGYDVESGAVLRRPHLEWHAWAGRPLSPRDRNSVLLGRGLGAVLDCVATSDEQVLDDNGTIIAKVRPFACKRNPIQISASTETGQLNALEPEVAGVVHAGLKDIDDRYIFMPLEMAQRLVNTKAITGYAVSLADPSDSAAFIQRAKVAATAAGSDVDVFAWDEHFIAEMYRRAMSLLGLLHTFVLTVVLTVAGISVSTTLANSIAERTREIGTLRSMGFRRRHIETMFAWESAILALLASTIGLALTLVIGFAINHSGIAYDGGVSADPIPLKIEFVPSTYLKSALLLSAIAVAATLFPARRASRMRIPDALSHI